MKLLVKYFCILFCVFTSSCFNDNRNIKHLRNNVLQQRIRNKLSLIAKKHKGYLIIEMHSLTDFDWDSVYFFHEEESGDFISSTTKIQWQGSSVPNSYERLIFVLKSQIVAYTDFNTEPSEGLPELPLFVYNCLQSNDRVIPKENARFAAFRYCERGSVNYVLVPLECLNRFESFKDMVIHGCPENDKKKSL